jgi:hypothetical protein
MSSFAPYPAADPFRALSSTFGAQLRFTRTGSVARWTFNGHLAEVELESGDRVVARFVAPSTNDAVSGRRAAAVYARDERGYALTPAGSERMVADIIAFFSGSREPAFRFVAAR